VGVGTLGVTVPGAAEALGAGLPVTSGASAVGDGVGSDTGDAVGFAARLTPGSETPANIASRTKMASERRSTERDTSGGVRLHRCSLHRIAHYPTDAYRSLTWY
jgi:hypothetical protein